MGGIEGADPLLAIAEVGVALAASTGIIMALTAERGAWRPFDRFRVLMLLQSSLGATVLALLPFAFDYGGLSAAALWRWCSGTLAAYLLLFPLPFFLSMFRSEPRADLRPAIAIVLSSWLAAVLVVQLLNASGLVFHGSLAAYFFGLLSMVCWASVIFVLLIFVRPRSEGGGS